MKNKKQIEFSKSSSLSLFLLLLFVSAFIVQVLPLQLGYAQVKPKGKNGTSVLSSEQNVVSEGNENKNATIIKVKYSFSQLEIKHYAEYTRLTIEGLDRYGAPGFPVLPLKTVRILLPPNRIISNIEVTSIETTQIDAKFVVEPGVEPAPVEPYEKTGVNMNKTMYSSSSLSHSQPTVILNNTIYGSSTPFPGKLFDRVSIQYFKGFQILVFHLYPVQYIPAEETIIYHSSMKVTVKMSPETVGQGYNMFRGSLKDREQVKRIVDNPEMLDAYPLKAEKIGSSYEYVVITDEALVSAFQPLIAWKNSKGVSSTIVTIQQILSNYTGYDTQEKIRNFIKNAYSSWGTRYVLLGGDVEIIPARGLSAAFESNIASDLYYACLDGTWDNDGDHIYGEYGEEDFYAEVYVGRAPVNTYGEAMVFVNKTLTYEQGQHTDYLYNVLMLGAKLDQITDGGITKDMIETVIPHYYFVTKLYERDFTASVGSTTNKLNEGQHIVNNIGHANNFVIGLACVDYSAYYSISDVYMLANAPRFFLFYTIGCYANAFDNIDPSGNQVGDAISEHFLNNPNGGAFAFIGNSRYGWYYQGNPGMGPSDLYDIEFFDAIYGEGIPNIGVALQDSKEDLVGLASIDDIMKWVYYDLNLLGDPETEIAMPPPPEHEISVQSIEAPHWLLPGETTMINATIGNYGLNDETNVIVRFIVDNLTMDSLTIPFIAKGTWIQVGFNWTAPPVEKVYNLTVYAEPVMGEEITLNNAKTKMVHVTSTVFAIFQDNYPWGLTANQQIMDLHNIGYDMYTSSDMGNVNLSKYVKVIIASDQVQTFYDTLALHTEWFEDYVSAGGVLEIHACDIGWHGGFWTSMPGGLSHVLSPSEYVSIACAGHPILLTPNIITDDELDNWHWATHGYFNATPELKNTILTLPTGEPVFIEAFIGNGTILASMQTLEWGYSHGYSRFLENVILYIPQRLQHDVAVNGLDVPSFIEPSLTVIVNATIANLGLSNESNVEALLLVNNTVAGSVTIPELKSGTLYEINYSWTPTVQGKYNVTAYVLPVPSETFIPNNVKSKTVRVLSIPDIIVVNDNDGNNFIRGTSLQDFASALNFLGYEYFVWDELSMGRPSLELLRNAKLVVWTCGDYWSWAVDPYDAATLEAYLAGGGNILLEGENIGYNHGGDDFMVNVAHAIYQVDNTGAPGLTVTRIHPVTLGLPSTCNWLIDPPLDDGVSPVNGGIEVIRYTGTSWTAVTVFEGTGSGSVVYYAFPLHCLTGSYKETLTVNSINWLLGYYAGVVVEINKGWYSSNEAIFIRANATMNGEPVIGANTTAFIIDPQGSLLAALTLYDDGMHGDNNPDDGIYANTFPGISPEHMVGTYSVLVYADIPDNGIGIGTTKFVFIGDNNLFVRIVNTFNEPAPYVYLNVLDQSSGNIVRWWYNADGDGFYYTTLPPGTYAVMAWSGWGYWYESGRTDNFFLLAKDLVISSVAVVTLNATEGVPILLQTSNINGQPEGFNIDFYPTIGGFGLGVAYTSSIGEATVYVTPDWYNIAARKYGAPSYYLYRLNVDCTSPAVVAFQPTEATTSRLILSLQKVSERQYGLAWIHPRSLPSPFGFGYSPNEVVVTPDLWEVWGGQIYIELQNGYWYYSIWCEPFKVYNLTLPQSSASFIFGGMLQFTLSVGESFNPGDLVQINWNLLDSFGNRIDWIYEVTEHLSGTIIVRDSKGMRILNATGEYQPAAQREHYPYLTIIDPKGSPILTTEVYWWERPKNYWLPGNAMNGTYTIRMEVNTGPYQGVVKGETYFRVGPTIELTLADFPAPFVIDGIINTTVIVGTSDPHGPCGSAHTLDTIGGMSITAKLGRYGEVSNARFYLDTDVAWYDGSKVHCWPVEGLTNIVTIAGPGVNMFTWKYFANPWYAPVYMYRDGDQWLIVTPTTQYVESDWVRTNPLRDLIIIEVIYVAEEGRYVLWVGGFGGYATRAGCLVIQLFNTGQLPFQLQGQAMLIQWIDVNDNAKIDLSDTWNVIEIIP